MKFIHAKETTRNKQSKKRRIRGFPSTEVVGNIEKRILNYRCLPKVGWSNKIASGALTSTPFSHESRKYRYTALTERFETYKRRRYIVTVAITIRMVIEIVYFYAVRKLPFVFNFIVKSFESFLAHFANLQKQ